MKISVEDVRKCIAKTDFITITLRIRAFCASKKTDFPLKKSWYSKPAFSLCIFHNGCAGFYFNKTGRCKI